MTAPRAAWSGAAPAGAGRLLRWRLAVPPEKGGWVWWIGPLAVGAFNAPGPGLALALVAAGALAAFCIRQPATLLIKEMRKAPGARRIAPSLFWASLYAAALALVAAGLAALDHAGVVALSLLALPVFAWHALLVYQRRQRRQMALDLSAAMALALTGPAAYWAGGGASLAAACWIWLLPGAQSAASIVHMFLRLEQRGLDAAPPLGARLRQGAVPMAAHAVGVLLAMSAWSAGYAGPAVALAMLIPAIEGGWSVLRPQVGFTPKRLGMRQLAVSGAAMALLLIGLKG